MEAILLPGDLETSRVETPQLEATLALGDQAIREELLIYPSTSLAVVTQLPGDPETNQVATLWSAATPLLGDQAIKEELLIFPSTSLAVATQLPGDPATNQVAVLLSLEATQVHGDLATRQVETLLLVETPALGDQETKVVLALPSSGATLPPGVQATKLPALSWVEILAPGALAARPAEVLL